MLVSLSWHQLSPYATDISTDVAESSARPNLAKCLLYVYVDSCQHLMRTGKLPSPQVELRIGNGQKQLTEPQHFTVNPVFEKSLVFIVEHPNTLNVVVKDSLLSSKSASNVSRCILGKTSIQMSDLILKQRMECSPPQPFNFQDGYQGTITMSVRLRAITELKEIAAAKNPI